MARRVALSGCAGAVAHRLNPREKLALRSNYRSHQPKRTAAARGGCHGVTSRANPEPEKPAAAGLKDMLRRYLFDEAKKILYNHAVPLKHGRSARRWTSPFSCG